MFKILLQNFIKKNGRTPNAIEMLQLKFKAASQANRGKVIPFKHKRDFAAEIKAMMDDGTIKVGEVTKKNDNVLKREMFKNSNLNKTVPIKKGTFNSQLNRNNAIDQGIEVEPVSENFIKYTIQDIKKKNPIEGMKISNQIIKREGDFKDLTKEQSQRILKETDDWIFQRDPDDLYDYTKKRPFRDDPDFDPDDMATGGRAGFGGGLLAQLGKGFTSPSTSEAMKLATRFMRVTGRKPNKDELLKIIREAAERDLDNAISGAKTPGTMSKDEFAMNVGGGSKAIGRRINEIDQDALRKSIDEFNTPIRTQEPFDFATGGRAGYYTGGITDVKPRLDDIGHGSDSLMARTRLLSPNNQATTSTGLNYLLAEDNDNIRVPFKNGKTYKQKLEEEIKKRLKYKRQGMEFDKPLGPDGTFHTENPPKVYEAAEGGRIGFSTGKLAGGIDSAIEKNKNLEERIAANKARTERFNKKMMDMYIRSTPEGVLMDSPPEKNSILSLGEEGTPQDGGAYSLNSDAYSNTIIFDDGTVYYKDTGEYYNDEGQVPGPSKGAKIKPKEMEAAEGGRIGFAVGGDAGRRAFLKLLATLGGGIAGLKSGLLSLGGKSAAKKAVPEIVKQSAGSGTPPPYFFKLVEKIKLLGDDTIATKDKAIATKYKDYTMEEDFAGNIEIIKKNNNISEDVYMSYKVDEVPLKKGKKGSTKVEEYEEFTATPDGDGKMKNVQQGVPDEVVNEGSVFEDDYIKFSTKEIEKADGGRIGFVVGGLSKLGITGSSRRFLEKVFGKQKFQNLIDNDPEMHRGMLEVVEMFRNKDKAGLVEYMQNYLPSMSKKELEAFIVGSGDTSGIQGQLIRLGSGRDYKGKLDMIEEANNIRKLDALDVDKMKPNAEGGRIGKWMGGPLSWGKSQLRELLKYMAKNSTHGQSPANMLKMVNSKQFNKMLNDPSIAGKFSAEAPEGVARLIKNYSKKMDSERADMLGELIGTGRKIKKVDDDIVTYKIKIVEDMVSKGVDRKMAEEMAETMAQMVSQQAGKKATPKITDQGLLEMENMQKNLITKDRKLQAAGGLTTMLGE